MSRWRRGIILALGLGGLLNASVGCSSDETQLVVVVDSDMDVPVALPAVEARVADLEGEVRSAHTFDVSADGAASDSQFDLPFSFAVVPRDGRTGERFAVEVEGLGEPRVIRRAVTGFLENQTLLLPMFLAGGCVGVECPSGFTCTEDGCRPEAVDPQELEPIEPGDEVALPTGPRDAGAGVDAGDMGDGGDVGGSPSDGGGPVGTQCGADQYVSGQGCVPCPEGTSNEPGDPTPGPDTECDPIRCLRNHRVVSHMCVRCPDGTTNVAGDDASMDDTSCDSDACSQALGVSCAEHNEAYLKASNADTGDAFGWFLAISGDGHTVAVGAPGEDSPADGVNPSSGAEDNGATEAGAVYVYARTGQTWREEAYLKASNSEPRDYFGSSVSLSSEGDRLAVGANGENSGRGAAYIFDRDPAGTWRLSARLVASNPDVNDFFGASVSLSGDGATLAVAASNEDSGASGINGDEDDDSVENAGAVYVFVRSESGQWTQQAYLKASNPSDFDIYGFSTAISHDGNRIIVGAPNESGLNDGEPDRGAAYVYVRSGRTWRQVAMLTASNAEAGDQFGFSVDMAGDGQTLVVGARGESSSATGVDGSRGQNDASSSGAAYVFHRASGESWIEEAYLKASNTGAQDEFGYAVGVSRDGNSLAVGALAEDGSATGVNGSNNDGEVNSGSMYLFERVSGSWSHQALLKASNTGAEDEFGISVEVSDSGDTVLVGARYEDGGSRGVNGNDSDNSQADSGAAYVRRTAPFEP